MKIKAAIITSPLIAQLLEASKIRFAIALFLPMALSWNPACLGMQERLVTIVASPISYSIPTTQKLSQTQSPTLAFNNKAMSILSKAPKLIALIQPVSCKNKGYRNAFPLKVGDWVKLHGDAYADDQVSYLGHKEIQIESIDVNGTIIGSIPDPAGKKQSFTFHRSCVNCLETQGKHFTNEDACIVPIQVDP